ncbi:hypothetical protein [Myroides profundi]|uniref:Uncharacterized protein n=2 Tax=Flavobacteriaceae TaxID=49546 RepID=A0AAJ4W696_MYRPR|nr:hypothetical protein [Myroides profundi]SER44049.1 hypothetical protein SAMN04488089_1169 [Myroides profundi]
MKFAIVILSLFMLFKPVLPVVEYVVLYDYIKDELCVNRDKPELECNGMCHLSKEMANASDTGKDKSKSNFASAEIQLVYFQDIVNNTSIHLFKNYTFKAFFSLDSVYTYTFNNFLFRPPV